LGCKRRAGAGRLALAPVRAFPAGVLESGAGTVPVWGACGGWDGDG